MIGINIEFQFQETHLVLGGGMNKYGHGDITGVSGVNFWTNFKKTTAARIFTRMKKYF